MSKLMFDEAVTNARKFHMDQTDVALMWADDTIEELVYIINRLVLDGSNPDIVPDWVWEDE